MKKVGILGGAFNPPTVGHIKLAEHVLKNTDLDEVWLTPCYSHRGKDELLDPLVRFRMCHLATEGTENIFAFKYEIDNKMQGSTFDFLSKLINDEQCDVEVSYIIGQDNANDFHKWHKYEELKSLCRFIVLGRTGVEEKEGEWYHDSPHIYLSWGLEECSSTMIREHILNYGRKERIPMLSPVVQKFIEKRNLYKCNGDVEFGIDKDKLKNLKEELKSGSEKSTDEILESVMDIFI
jgi:nicotinate-nucleotide adenylyltransferase